MDLGKDGAQGIIAEAILRSNFESGLDGHGIVHEAVAEKYTYIAHDFKMPLRTGCALTDIDEGSLEGT